MAFHKAHWYIFVVSVSIQPQSNAAVPVDQPSIILWSKYCSTTFYALIHIHFGLHVWYGWDFILRLLGTITQRMAVNRQRFHRKISARDHPYNAMFFPVQSLQTGLFQGWQYTWQTSFQCRVNHITKETSVILHIVQQAHKAVRLWHSQRTCKNIRSCYNERNAML